MTWARASVRAIFAAVLVVAAGACSDHSAAGADDAASGNGGAGVHEGGKSSATSGRQQAAASGGQVTSGGDSNSTNAGDSAGGNAGNSSVGAFRFGVNAGYPNPKFNDQDLAALAVRAGANSQRVSLPEQFLEKWGYDIQVADMQAYVDLGMPSFVGFLTAPTREHSTAPADTTDDNLVYYIPKNLYEPVTLSNGQINPDNYWANYVYKTVATYGQWIKVWEIWNEPDWVSDWQVTQKWPNQPPTSADLPHFNGSVFDYVRMLRVSHEAARLADPAAQIATGGLGYASFLDAVLRYSDEPSNGSIDAEHPSTGKAYIDVLSFHYYPIYTKGNSDAGVDGFLAQKAGFKTLLDQAQLDVGWECTETGAPHVALDGVPSGGDYAKNYLLKVMTLAQTAGVAGVHWFVLADAKTPGASTDPYSFMGLFQSVAALDKPSGALLTDTGVAYATLESLLGSASFDADATEQLALPDNIRGARFRNADKSILVLWAVAADGSETASASFDLATTLGVTEYDWNASATGVTTDIPVKNGAAQLDLSATPRFFVMQP